MVREIFDLESLWRDIEALDGSVTTDAQHAGYHEIRRLIDRATRWLVDVRFPISDVGAEIARFGPSIAELSPQLPELLCGVERTALEADTDALVAAGLPRELSPRISRAAVGVPAARRGRDRRRPSSNRRPRSPRCTSRCRTGSASTRC